MCIHCERRAGYDDSLDIHSMYEPEPDDEGFRLGTEPQRVMRRERWEHEFRAKCPRREFYMGRVHEGHCRTCGVCLVHLLRPGQECLTCESKAMNERIEAAMKEMEQ